MNKMPEIFGSMVFNESVMQARLPKDVYKAWKKTMTQNIPLQLDAANVIANAMKDWAVEKGATHFTHWFQPMTGITAEKHDSFIVPTGDGRALMEFSGAALVHGEPDASSFPSGGLRATFEARGYTVWDVTSYAFIKDGNLFIPTAFCSYSGEALDKKTPLLKSMQAINIQALRILRLFGNTGANAVLPMVGPEQEYFLVDKKMCAKRPDLVYSGRTLFGARPPKGQEMDDHYYGSIKPRVAAYMEELEEELWKLGIFAKTKHNEAAPAQHELAPIFCKANIATDHNQLTMDMMKNVADRHGLVCLLHEKPFAGVNGSGKHNNWSLATDTGANLLEPGETPHENAQFLLFLMAVVKAVDEYQDLLRVTCASAGNDHRLGANEAPPAIMSVFLGDELAEILEAIESKEQYENKEHHELETGVTVLPHFLKDTTDRNRTSPLAFTGNKFEFRMLGSASSIAGPNIVINTIVAEALRQFADELEPFAAISDADFTARLWKLIRRVLREHKRIIFNGDNYSDDWVAEAARRGLSNIPDSTGSFGALISEKSIELFARHNVLRESELHSRCDIHLENFCKAINVEAYTMVEMLKGLIIPAVLEYQQTLITLLNAKKGEFDTSLETHLLENISRLSAELLTALTAFDEILIGKNGHPNPGEYYSGKIIPAMQTLREITDKLETLTAKKYWPLPTYGELLHSVV
ncbi:MAG: glutamine synthetase III [Defluviitaleaceae bacterium]|nr:glutamine synthetase III [Defluviitaleaceae bacterium]MCL2261749.1 glutamine synthetase III [Defluviitaleaceae bacterium]